MTVPTNTIKQSANLDNPIKAKKKARYGHVELLSGGKKRGMTRGAMQTQLTPRGATKNLRTLAPPALGAVRPGGAHDLPPGGEWTTGRPRSMVRFSLFAPISDAKHHMLSCLALRHTAHTRPSLNAARRALQVRACAHPHH